MRFARVCRTDGVDQRLRYSSAMLLVMLGCADPRVDELQARLAAAEVQIAQLKASHAGEPSPMTRDERTGEMVPLLDAPAVTSCAVGALKGLATAEQGHDAAFDEYKVDLVDLGWQIDPTRGCHRYLAIRVELTEDDRGRVRDFVGTAVITRGTERGRSFEIHRDSKVNEVPRRSEGEVVAFLATPGWTGTAE